MAKYYVRPDGLHESIRTINGKRVPFRGKSDREVDKKILGYREIAKKGRRVKEIAKEWEISRESEISESSRHVYSYAVARLVDSVGDKFSSEVTPQELQKQISDFARTHSRNTAQIELAVMKMIFDAAVVSGDIAASPADKVRLPKHTVAPKRRESLTDEQERALVALEDHRKGEGVSLGYFLMFTGCRRGEALALSYSDIDFKAGCIHITKKLSYASGNPVLEDHLKSANGLRDIPLLPSLAARIPKNRIGLLFPGKDGGFMRASEIHSLWRAYCREAGLNEIQQTDNGEIVETFPITPHCLRHSFATICYEAGIDPRQAAEIVGDTPQVLETVYTHLRDGHRKSAADKLAEYVTTLEQSILSGEKHG
ncbi:putative integrase [Oscillibacter valericigenes Sjm18-20]|nr:putative integrase [Oscillibacter valericigenes Sjm18-20]